MVTCRHSGPGDIPQTHPLMTQSWRAHCAKTAGTCSSTGEGLIEVTASRVAVLTDLAVPADRIDGEAKAEEAR